MVDGDWNFGVKAYPIQVIRDGGEIIKPEEFKAIVHDTKPIVYYVGSDKYLPISHRDLLTPVINKIDQNHFTMSIITTHQGGRLYATILNNKYHDIPHIGQMKFGTKIVNSLDGSRRVEIHTILLRLVCSNGMVATHILGGVKRRHLMSTDVNIASVDAFAHQVCEQLNNAKILDNLSRLLIPITKETFEHVLYQMELPAKYVKKTQEIWEMPEVTSITAEERDTAWGAYNIISYVLTHEAPKMSVDRQHDFSVALDRAIAQLVT
jgi:hypothetical protein